MAIEVGTRVYAEFPAEQIAGTGTVVEVKVLDGEYTQHGILYVTQHHFVLVALDEPDSHGRARVRLPLGAVEEVD